MILIAPRIKPMPPCECNGIVLQECKGRACDATDALLLVTDAATREAASTADIPHPNG